MACTATSASFSAAPPPWLPPPDSLARAALAAASASARSPASRNSRMAWRHSQCVCRRSCICWYGRAGGQGVRKQQVQCLLGLRGRNGDAQALLPAQQQLLHPTHWRIWEIGLPMHLRTWSRGMPFVSGMKNRLRKGRRPGGRHQPLEAGRRAGHPSAAAQQHACCCPATSSRLHSRLPAQQRLPEQNEQQAEAGGHHKDAPLHVAAQQ